MKNQPTEIKNTVDAKKIDYAGIINIKISFKELTPVMTHPKTYLSIIPAETKTNQQNNSPKLWPR